jgi:hypothetical protein
VSSGASSGKSSNFDDQDTPEYADGYKTKNQNKLSSKNIRLVDWNVETLQKFLKQIVARRNCSLRGFFSKKGPNEEIYKDPGCKMVVHEIKEIIKLPKFDRITEAKQQAVKVELDENVVDQLKNYIATIASMYNDTHCKS